VNASVEKRNMAAAHAIAGHQCLNALILATIYLE
jgi:hypothetical protein